MRGTPDFAVTAQRRTTLGIQTLTSTDIENSTPLSCNILRTEDALVMRFSREVKRRSELSFSGVYCRYLCLGFRQNLKYCQK